MDKQNEEQDDSNEVKRHAIAASLMAAGIASQYSHPIEHLNNYPPEGKALSEWFLWGKGVESLKSGRGIYFSGATIKASALFHLTCRAALLCSVKTRVLSLPQFCDAVCTPAEWELEREAAESLVLGLQGFFDPAFPQAFTDRERFRMAWVLQERIMACRAVVLHGAGPFAELKAWWPDSLVALIQERCDLIAV